MLKRESVVKGKNRKQNRLHRSFETRECESKWSWTMS